MLLIVRPMVDYRSPIDPELPIPDSDRHFYAGQSATILRGRDVVFSGRVSGRPTPRVTWRLPSGRRLGRGQSEGRAAVLDNGDLRVKNAQSGDAGVYSIVASNSAGADRADIGLRVLGRKLVSSVRKRLVNGLNLDCRPPADHNEAD